MNKRDRDNLNFILYSDKETIHKWFHSLSKDDADYAIWLLKTASTEMMLQKLDNIEEEYFSDYESDAKAVLKKIMKG